jgi:hypothetical protein
MVDEEWEVKIGLVIMVGMDDERNCVSKKMEVAADTVRFG